MSEEFQLTKKGIEELNEELEKLKASRSDIANKLKTAREYGDLSENAEYHNARDEQVQVEGRIKEIEKILKNVELIDDPKDKDTVELGNEVQLKGVKGDQQFTVVGSVEADPVNGLISNKSPIGEALMGKKVGEEVVINLPSGEQTYTIKSIK